MAGVEYHPEDHIAALATPAGKSAIALIRTSGRDCIERVAPLFSSPLSLRKASSHSALYGTLRNPESGDVIDDVVLIVYRSGNSYTGEESVEIMPHGSVPGVRMILELLVTHGFRHAKPGEFTLRAFLNGKMDLPRAEAVRELIESKTQTAHSIAAKRLEGELSELFGELKASLLDVIGPVELALDYPEEETGTPLTADPFRIDVARDLVRQTREVLERFRVGRIYQEGYRVVIAGATNAGKSSLFNLLLREERSIVSEIHGTTRDYIESWISLRELPVRLYDTAGLRDDAADIETEGIRRTESLLLEADCILYVVDSTMGEGSEDRRRLEELGLDRCVLIWSKSDLQSGPAPEGYLSLSTVSGEGFDALEEAVFSMAGGVYESDISVYLESDHQKQCLSRFVEAMERSVSTSREGYPLDAVATDLGDAVAALGELTGEITSSEVLDAIFSKFCVGK